VNEPQVLTIDRLADYVTASKSTLWRPREGRAPNHKVSGVGGIAENRLAAGWISLPGGRWNR
jgi:hypothetical protein